MIIKKIAVTGGPCAGKSTALSWVQNAFNEKGYTVLFVSEAATELMLGGIRPTNAPGFQKHLMNLQIFKEDLYRQAAEDIGKDKVLIICDRGRLDCKAYMTDEQFNDLAKELGGSEIEYRDNYDAVFHLVTAAKGAEEYYTLSNNDARTETTEEARILDDKTLLAWNGHPHLRVIDNSTGLKEKMDRLIDEISRFLGEPLPMKMERKFLIRKPDIEKINGFHNVKKVEIEQTYTKISDNEEIRIRRRGVDGDYIYYMAKMEKLAPNKRVEIEKRLSKHEYDNMLLGSDESAKISKDRYYVMYDDRNYEIDIYPFMKDEAIMEIKVNSENEEVKIPEGIEVIKEITGDKEYMSASLAKRRKENVL